MKKFFWLPPAWQQVNRRCIKVFFFFCPWNWHCYGACVLYPCFLPCMWKLGHRSLEIEAQRRNEAEAALKRNRNDEELWFSSAHVALLALLLLLASSLLELKSNLAFLLLLLAGCSRLIIFQKGTRGEKLGTHTHCFQSQLSWGFLINECLPEFSILFDFAPKQPKEREGKNEVGEERPTMFFTFNEKLFCLMKRLQLKCAFKGPYKSFS